VTKLEQMIKDLPPDLCQEIEDFIENLKERKGSKVKRQLKLDWAGACKELRDQYTSVELQHKISDWMVGKE
jgi:hypothetical protein